MQKNRKFEKDLTEGNVLKQLIVFAIPFFISNLIQSAYSVADMIILGNFAGENSLSGVNTASQLLMIFTNLAVGISAGGSVMVGQFLGAKQKEKINYAISTLLLTLLGLGLFVSTTLLVFRNPILTALKVPENAYVEAKKYLEISLYGLVFVFGYNALSAIMQGLGDSRTPLIFVGAAGVLNIVLDIVLVAVWHKGAEGAALATILAQGLSMIACIIYLKCNDFQFDFSLRSFIWKKEMFVTLMKVGLPTGVQHVCTNTSFLVLTAMINAAGGVAAGAASGVVNKFNAFAILPSVAISSSVSAMISQNMGAGKVHRVKKAAFSGMGLCMIICAVVFTIANVFSVQIFNIFGAEPEVIDIGVKYMHAFSFEYVTLSFIVAFNSVFIGTGNGWISLVTNLLSAFAVRIPVAYLLGTVLGYGVVGVGYSIPIATFCGSSIAAIFYFAGAWKKNRMDNMIEQ